MVATHNVSHEYATGFIMLALPGGDDSGDDLWFQLNHSVKGILAGVAVSSSNMTLSSNCCSAVISVMYSMSTNIL